MSAVGSHKPVRSENRRALTANRLLDGAVIWRTKDGRWSLAFEEAHFFEPDLAPAALEAAGRESLVAVAAYLIEVDGAGRPTGLDKTREIIRAFGPSLGLVGSKQESA